MDSITESAIGEMDEAVRVHMDTVNVEVTPSIDSMNTQFLNQAQEIADGHVSRPFNRRERRLYKKHLELMQNAQAVSSQTTSEGIVVEDSFANREENTRVDPVDSPHSLNGEEMEAAPDVHYHSDRGSKWNPAVHSSKN